VRYSTRSVVSSLVICRGLPSFVLRSQNFVCVSAGEAD